MAGRGGLVIELRLVQPADVGEFLRVSESSGLFRPEELPAVEGMLSAHFAAGDSSEQTILVSESEGRLTGVVCFTERPFADRVWELQMIAVAGDLQGRGIGSQLLRAVECVVRDRGGRLLLIETSDQGRFERTRSFYRRHGYDEVARIPDYFSDGDGKVSFVLRIAAAATSVGG